jgi:hypothetical protein
MGNNAVQVGPLNLRTPLERRDYLFIYLCIYIFICALFDCLQCHSVGYYSVERLHFKRMGQGVEESVSGVIIARHLPVGTEENEKYRLG